MWGRLLAGNRALEVAFPVGKRRGTLVTLVGNFVFLGLRPLLSPAHAVKTAVWRCMPKRNGLFAFILILALTLISIAGPIRADEGQKSCARSLLDRDLIFSPKAIRAVRALGLQDEIVSLQESYTGVVMGSSREGFWTLLASHAVDNDRFQDLLLLAELIHDDSGRAVIDNVKYAPPRMDYLFFRRVAKIHDVPAAIIQVSFDQSGQKFNAKIEVPPEIMVKIKFKHGIGFASLENPLPDYRIEKILPGGEDQLGYSVFLLRSLDAPTVSVSSSPFSVLSHLGSPMMVEEKIEHRRRRLKMVVRYSKIADYQLVSLYEIPFRTR